MGVLDLLGDAGDAIGNYFSRKFTGVGHAYKDAWTKTLPTSAMGVWSGALTMAQSPQHDRDSFGKGLRLWLDSATGVAGGLLQGTIGGAFEAPVLSEAAWGLDKAYRYAIARPLSWQFLNLADTQQRVAEAHSKGDNGFAAILDTYLDKDVWFGDKGMWSDSVGNVTPGQALVYDIGGAVGQLNPWNTGDPMEWLQSHDPRTPQGQAKFNSDNSEFLLKYASGTTDLLLNVGLDPSEAASAAIKASKAKYFDHVATPDYIAKDLHSKEVGSKAYEKFYQAALKAETPEELRWKTNLAYTALGGSVAPVLWAAAKKGKDIFADTYVIARGMDGLRDPANGLGAWDRLRVTAPAIVSDMVNMFAAWNIGEDSLMSGRNALASGAVDSLVLHNLDAWLAALLNRDGLIGTLPAKLRGEAQPKASLAAATRAGIHSWVLHTAPIVIGKPAAKTLAAFLPSQGWTPMIDSEDSSALSLRQFKANLERAGLPAERVDWWTSQWGSKGSSPGRTEVYERAETEMMQNVADRLGLTPEVVKKALADISRYRHGARQIMTKNRVYLAERASRLGGYLVAAGRPNEGKAMKALNKDLTREQKKGGFGDTVVVMPDGDGRTNVIPLLDSDTLPPQSAPLDKPLLSTQTERMIPTIDFRALEAQLKWHMRAHPYKMVVDPATGQRRLPKTTDEEDDATIVPSPLMPVALAHKYWDAAITGADFANMLWKSSALLRPAQMPRNLGSDILARMLVMGKADIIMDSMRGTKRAFQNMGRRGALKHEVKAEELARRGATRTRTAVVLGDWQGPLTKKQALNADIAEHAAAGTVHEDMQFADITDAWKQGAISFDQFVYMIKTMAGSKGRVQMQVPDPLLYAIEAADRKIFAVSEPFTSPKAPSTKVWHDRALKRRIIEYVWSLDENGRPSKTGGGPTKFLEDMRLAGEHRTTGRPLDPKYDPDLPDPRAGWLQKVINRHITMRRAAISAGSGDPRNYYRQGEMVVDPFTGISPKDFDGLQDFTLFDHQVLTIKSKTATKKGVTTLTGEPNFQPGAKYAPGNPTDEMMNYIIDHVDDLLKPGHLLSLGIMPDANIRIAVARVKPEAAHKGPVTSRPTAKQRLQNFNVDGIVDMGHTDIELRVRSGVDPESQYHAGETEYHEGMGDDEAVTTVKFPAAFGGPEGQSSQHRVSAQAGSGSLANIVSDTDMSRILDQMGGWGVSRPAEKGYAQNWERAVNAQLAGDEIARMVLEDATDTDIYRWIENNPGGHKYVYRMHYLGTNYVDHVQQIRGMVGIYVPFQDTVAGHELRQAVLDRTATHEMLARVVPDLAERPTVHGAAMQYSLGKGPVFDMMSRGIDRAQKLIGDLPTDKASRFPFFSASYKRHVQDLVRVADDHAFRAEEYIPTRLLENIESQARTRALYDTKYHLYDVAQMNDIARFMRFVMPFSSAIIDSYIKFGRIARENPGVILQGAYYWQMFERNEQIQDENGYILHKEGGEDKWYSVDPETGVRTEVPADKVGSSRYVVFRLPSDLEHIGPGAGPGAGLAGKALKSLYGVKALPVIAINKKSFNVFIDLPTTGPMVALPANEFALHNPEFGDNKIIKQFVLPFGPTNSRGKVFLPSSFRTAWDAFASNDGLKGEAQAKAIFQAELIAYGRGERDTPPSFAEVRSRAGMMKGLRFMTSFVSPLSMQYNSPYQPYINAYRQMVATDPDNADEKFLAQYGDEFYAVAMSVTRNNAGVPSTLEGDKAFKAHKDLIAEFPDLAGLIVGSDGAGEFSKSVYEAQKMESIRPGDSQKVRETLGLEDSVRDLEKRRVWEKYSKMQDLLTANMADLGLTSLRGSRAADLAKIRNAFIETNKYWTDPVSNKQAVSPWYDDFTTTNHAAMDNRIEAMWQIVQDPTLQKRDDIRGLIDYLTMRERTQQEMARRGFATLTSQQAAPLAKTWETSTFGLRESNPAFGALWNRWLSNDDQLSVGGV